MDAMHFLQSKKTWANRSNEAINIRICKKQVPRGRIIKAESIKRLDWLRLMDTLGLWHTKPNNLERERGIHFLCACILGVPSLCIFFFYPKMGWGLGSIVSLVLEWPTSTTWFGSWCGRCRHLLTKFINLIHQTWATASRIVVTRCGVTSYNANNPNRIIWELQFFAFFLHYAK